MQLNDYMKKVIKIFIFAFLCTEMQTTFTHQSCGQIADTVRSVAKVEQITSRLATSAPYQASIRLLAQERQHFGKGHICSGALVAPSVVLTVAHCLYDETRHKAYHPAELRVVLGNMKRFAPTGGTLTFGVTHIYQAPDFNAITLANNIAILMLDQDVPFDQTSIKPITLSEVEVKPSISKRYQMTSWGLDSSGRELHELNALWAQTNPCSSHHICVSYELEYSDRVPNDPGAPLISTDGLVGLQSGKNKFVNVARHVRWIHHQVGDGTNRNSSIWGIMGFVFFTAYVVKCSYKTRIF